MPIPIYERYALHGGETMEVIVGYTDTPAEMCSKFGHQFSAYAEPDGSFSCTRCHTNFNKAEAELEFERLENLMGR